MWLLSSVWCLFFFVFEACFVGSMSRFESSGCEAYVDFFISGGYYFCFVDDVLGGTFAR